jgi:hypothetical protein
MELQGHHEPLQVREPSFPAEGCLEACREEQRLNVSDADPSPLERIAVALERLADHLAPDPDNMVGTDYVAGKMGCTQTHVARLARDGGIPISCIVAGCGDGRPWKFLRARVDDWLGMR